MMLAINVAAMLIAFIAGIAMINFLLRQLGPHMTYHSFRWNGSFPSCLLRSHS